MLQEIGNAILKRLKQFWHWSVNFEDDSAFTIRMMDEYEKIQQARLKKLNTEQTNGN